MLSFIIIHKWWVINYRKTLPIYLNSMVPNWLTERKFIWYLYCSKDGHNWLQRYIHTRISLLSHCFISLLYDCVTACVTKFWSLWKNFYLLKKSLMMMLSHCKKVSILFLYCHSIKKYHFIMSYKQGRIQTLYISVAKHKRN